MLICTLFTGHPVRRVFLCAIVMSSREMWNWGEVLCICGSFARFCTTIWRWSRILCWNWTKWKKTPSLFIGEWPRIERKKENAFKTYETSWFVDVSCITSGGLLVVVVQTAASEDLLHNISHQLHNWIRQYSNMPGSKKEKTLFILLKCLKITKMARV